MNYNKIRKLDISNGPGVRVSIFVQGCTFNCKECFNPETHDFNGGKEFTEETMRHLLDLGHKGTIKGLSILGGEPLHPKNVDTVTEIARIWKETLPNKPIWVWTGYRYDSIIAREDPSILNYIDVLVDGQFDITKKNITLKYCGSENQRVIDIMKSLEANEVVLYNER